VVGTGERRRHRILKSERPELAVYSDMERRWAHVIATAARMTDAIFELESASPVMIQGITGRMGRRHAARMRAYGTHIVGGTSRVLKVRTCRASRSSPLNKVYILK